MKMMEILSPQTVSISERYNSIFPTGKLRSEFTKPHARSFLFTDFHSVQQSKNQNENFFTKVLFSKKKFHFGFLIATTKLLRTYQTMGIKVEEEDPTDLLPKISAEKMTRRLSTGSQFDL